MLADFAEIVRGVTLRPPRIRAGLKPDRYDGVDEVIDPAYWVRHVRETVRFRAGFERLADGDVFLEAGPQPVLLGLGRQCLEANDALWLPSLSQRRGDWRQILEGLGALYSRGAEIDWRGFDAPYRRRKIALPGYPFERQHYGIPKPGGVDQRRRGPPLIDDVLRSPLVDETVFCAKLSTTVYPFFADHRIFGEIVAPAASFVALLLNGAGEITPEPCRLDDLYFITPLVFSAGRDLDRPDRHQARRRLPDRQLQGGRRGGSDAPRNGPPQFLGGGHRSGAGNARPIAGRPAGALRRSDRSSLWLSEGIEGIEFGPHFRWIEAIWSDRSETLARLRRPDVIDDAVAYRLHPGLLDACFQSAEATLGDDGEPPLPFGIRRLATSGAGSGDVWWTHARQVGEFMWDIRLYDAHGAVIAVIDGFEARKAPRSGFRRTAEWLYRIDWQPQPLKAAPAPELAGNWLIVGDDAPFDASLAERLRAMTATVTVASPAKAEAAIAAGSAPWRGIIFVCKSGDGPDDPAAGAQTVSLRALELAQAMARAQTTARLWFVTTGSAAVEGTELAAPSSLLQAPIWGFVRSLGLEHPEWRPSVIDLPIEPSAAELDALAAELAADTTERQVALRADGRHVARLVRHRAIRLDRPGEPFRLMLDEYGSPERLRLAPLTRRPPGPGEVEIEIKAGALNFRDVLIALGLLQEHYARNLKIERAADIRLGFDSAGIIAAVGEGVPDLRVGDEVMASAVGGSASFLTLPYTDVVRKARVTGLRSGRGDPDGLPDCPLRLASAGRPYGERARADPRGLRRRRPSGYPAGAGGRRGDFRHRQPREMAGVTSPGH